MKLVIEPYEALPCELKVFTINDQNADKSDFGYGYDAAEDEAEPYACGKRIFESDYSKAEETCKKYSITFAEFYFICNELESKLFVGACGWCI